MLNLIKKKLTSDKFINITRNIGMILVGISAITFFEIHTIFPKVFIYQIIILILGIFLVLFAAICTFLKGYIPFLKANLKDYYAEHPEDRPRKRKNDDK